MKKINKPILKKHDEAVLSFAGVSAEKTLEVLEEVSKEKAKEGGSISFLPEDLKKKLPKGLIDKYMTKN